MDPEARRAAILAVARRQFATQGFHRTGIADIVAEAGVARGTFYRYFESKRAIFGHVLDEMMAEVVSVVRPIDIAAPIAPQVFANLDRLVRAITAQDVCRVLFTEAVGIDAEADDAVLAFYHHALARIEAALRTGQQLGVVQPGDVALKARCLLGLIKEPVVQASLEGRAVDTDLLVQEILGLLQHGLLITRR